MSALAAASEDARRLASVPPLVGRCDQLERIELVLGDVARGVSSGALVVGDAGTGKSRMLAEAAGMAAGHDIRTAGASCLPLSIRLPLDPVLELLRILGDPVEAADRRTPDQLFGPVVERLVRASREGPLLVCLDDLQWSDEATVELVHYCLVRLQDLPLAWLLSARLHPTRIGRTHRLERAASLARIELGPLGREDTRHLTEYFTDRPAPEDLADVMLARAGGNPALTVALLDDLATRPGPLGDQQLLNLAATILPVGIREAADEQVAGLSPGAQAAIEWAAVLWEPFRAEELEASISRPVADDLPELLEAGLLIAGHTGWRFRHAVVRDAIHHRLGSMERARRHGVVADSVPDVAPALRAAQLEQAGRWADAARVCLELTEPACGATAGQDVVALCEHTGVLAARAQDASLAREADARAILALVGAGRLGVDEPEVGGFCGRLRAGADPDERVCFLGRLALSAMEAPRAWDPARVHDLVAEAESLLGAGDLQGRALLCVAKSCLEIRRGDPPRALGCARDAADQIVALQRRGSPADSVRDPTLVAWLRAAVGRVLADAGDLDGAREHQSAALQQRRSAARDTTEIALTLVDTHLMRGDLATARQLLEDHPPPDGRYGDPRLPQLWGLLLEQEDRLEEALGCFESAALQHPSSASHAAGGVRVAVALGHLDKARLALGQLESLAGRLPAGACAHAEARAWVGEADQRPDEAARAFLQAAALARSAYHQARLGLEAAELTANRCSVRELTGRLEAMGATRAVHRAREIARGLGMRPLQRAPAQPGALTPRETAVVALIAAGHTNAEIATQLCVSPKTIERHVTHILAKLGMRSRVQVATQAARGRLPTAPA